MKNKKHSCNTKKQHKTHSYTVSENYHLIQFTGTGNSPLVTKGTSRFPTHGLAVVVE